MQTASLLLENPVQFVEEYLSRIQVSQPIDNSLESLNYLHKQHLLTIPIENLDIHYGCKILLDSKAIFDKIIRRRRGGFCYELNGLFYELLKNLGFGVNMISGRVYVPGINGGYFRDEFDHMAILVHIDDTTWLADVAMGRLFSMYPLQIMVDVEQEDPTGIYRIIRHDETYYCVQQKNGTEDWATAYIFTLIPRQLQDFASMCEVQQTSPASYFTQNKVCTIMLPQGRVTLTDTKLKITSGKQVLERAVLSTADFEKTLHKHFGIHIPLTI